MPIPGDTMVDDDIQMSPSKVTSGDTHNLGSKFITINSNVVAPITPNSMVDGVEYSRLHWKRKKSNNIDSLLDELLLEILCRLPCHKTLVSCKAVCKQWAALVSQPFLIRRFIAYKAGKHSTLYACKNGLSKYDRVRMEMMNDRKFGLVVSMYRRGKYSPKGFMISFNDPIYNPTNVSLSPLPRLINAGLPPKLTPIAACNDLVLYHRYEGDAVSPGKLQLYIINAQTKQWLKLPSLPLQRMTKHIGLICDPYYSIHTGNLTLNATYGTCIVVIPFMLEYATEFSAHLLSPNTGGFWRSVVLSLPSICRPSAFCGFFCIGRKLYFVCSDGLGPSVLHGYVGRLISFDPFVDNDVIKCSLLPLPSIVVPSTTFFGVFHGRLYMSDCDDDGRYRIWVLEDYETGQWSLRHSIMGQDWIPHDDCLAKLVHQDPCFGSGISFHPAIPDVIYMLCNRWIILCNLSTREMKVAYKLPKGCRDMFPSARSIQIMLPVWPTPLPTFAHEGNLHSA